MNLPPVQKQQLCTLELEISLRRSTCVFSFSFSAKYQPVFRRLARFGYQLKGVKAQDSPRSEGSAFII